MSELNSKDLVNAKEFIENGRFGEASQVLKDIGEREDLSHYDQISYYIIFMLIIKLKEK